jgi:hypothetical protein
MANVIPADVRNFLMANIDSVAELEALLILRRDAHYKWSCGMLAEQLYISQQDTAAVLAKLVQRGLVSMEELQPAVFQYHIRNDELAQVVNHVAEVYTKYLIPITNFIHQKPRQSVQDFADAFTLKKQE